MHEGGTFDSLGHSESDLTRLVGTLNLLAFASPKSYLDPALHEVDVPTISQTLGLLNISVNAKQANALSSIQKACAHPTPLWL